MEKDPQPEDPVEQPSEPQEESQKQTESLIQDEADKKIEETKKKTDELAQALGEIEKDSAGKEETYKHLIEAIKSGSMSSKDPIKQKALQEFQKYKTLYEKHAFWDTQPVPKTSMLSKPTTEGEIEKGNIDEVPTEPYNLPPGFYWSDIDLEDEAQLEEVYVLLRDHYVEDTDAMFRFDYQKEFLKWALLPPKQQSDWIFGVRGGKKNALYGFITGIPVKIRINGKLTQMVEINFLCVHKKFRQKRLAPVLIKEVTRRTNLKRIWQAVYTSGTLIPKPFAESTYWYRDINIKKLVDVGFSSIPHGRAKSIHMKLLSIPKTCTIEYIRPMEAKDAKKVHALLNEYLENLKVSIHLNKDEVQHFLLPRKNVIYSYVVIDPETQEITDFISFYSLPSTILKNTKHSTLYAAFSYYMVPKKHSISDLIKNALILAQQNKFDVFNCLDIMNNKEAFEGLHFGIGTGNLHYYLYNWNLKKIQPNDVGIVLV